MSNNKLSEMYSINCLHNKKNIYFESLSSLFSQNDIHQDGKDGVTVAKTPAKRERSGSSGPCSTTSSTNHWLSAYSEAQITPRKITSELIENIKQHSQHVLKNDVNLNNLYLISC